MRTISIAEISEKMRRTSPAFIVGAPRSGTTLLYRLLQEHASFRPKRMDLTETHIFAYADASYKLNKEWPDSQFSYRYMLKDSSKYDQFLHSIRRIQVFHRLINIQNVFRKISNRIFVFWLSGLNHFVIRSFFYHAQLARECHRIIEKTPGHDRHIPQILYSFPEAKLIYICRHPVDVYSSYRKRYETEAGLGRKQQDITWLRITPEDFCKEYRRSVGTLLKAGQNSSSSICLIKYEDLTGGETGLTYLYDFLGEPCPEDGGEQNQSGDYRWEPEPHLFGPIKTSTKDWKDYLHHDEARFIEARLKKTIEELSYHFYTNPL